MPDNAAQLAAQNFALTRELLEWIASRPHSYAELMEVWRSSCPRHTIWEDAVAAGLVDWDGTRGGILSLTAAGRSLVARG